MWAKSVTQFLIIQAMLILQISYGKPTSEEFFSLNTTDKLPEIEREDVNSSYQASVSILLTVLSPNDTVATTALIANTNSTSEPEYDDYNATSHTLSEMEEDDLGSFSINGSSNATHSSLLPLLITDEMEMADSLDDSVTATLMLQEDHSSNVGSTTTTSSSSAVDDDGDSIIIASMSSNLSQDTAQPPSPSPNSATVATENSDEESSRSGYSSSSESSLLPYVEILL
ncbi:unnamed protein product [Orchesella dallaii]|uniref:Uncharacterized protein n=1 Tax=Orchesella dallaii TaxID=48710 RepID=A0ABP1R1P0_9HEXA